MFELTISLISCFIEIIKKCHLYKSLREGASVIWIKLKGEHSLPFKKKKKKKRSFHGKASSKTMLTILKYSNRKQLINVSHLAQL
jgi:hypothetical protein